MCKQFAKVVCMSDGVFVIHDWQLSDNDETQADSSKQFCIETGVELYKL